ncbi:hypothetical protein AKJ09_06466 [Labilithrix luteola]|uniref:Uncharacterized protein n=1 Tax=Labilithrix luteola TaxID=1391654 RepID=A0A0K1Q250_9BACT|nr:hypothetical protein AKJ09_06466 [Labilithrix luteola]
MDAAHGLSCSRGVLRGVSTAVWEVFGETIQPPDSILGAIPRAA